MVETRAYIHEMIKVAAPLRRMRYFSIAAALLATLIGLSIGWSGSAEAQSSRQASSVAEYIYTNARPQLLQIRTLVIAAGRQSSIGSAFLVSADGLAITNYHVISQFALEPKTYRLEYTSADGHVGPLQLLGIDLANDLALVKIDRGDQPFLKFDDRATSGTLPNGERLYSMGNPLDLGFTIVEGTYNGLVERSYTDRIHFSGAVNPGMSGGPTVTAESRIAGINVAKRLGSDLVSFLVPARHALELLKRVQAGDIPPDGDFRAEIGRQLTAWQSTLYKTMADDGFRASTFGAYKAVESAAPWFTCWAQTNAGRIPKPRADVSSTTCNGETQLYIASDLTTGLVRIGQTYLQSTDLNQFQFASLLSEQGLSEWSGRWSRRWQTPPRCTEDFVAIMPSSEHPPLRVVWCARAYRDFEGIYDTSLMAVTQDDGKRALVSRLILQSVSYDNAILLSKRFIEAIQWAK